MCVCVCCDFFRARPYSYFDETLERVMAKGRATAFDRDCVAHLGERLSIKLIDAHCRELDLPSALCESDNVSEMVVILVGCTILR